MSDHKFKCPACGQSIACDAAGAGQSISCPSCQAALTVPPLLPAAASKISPPARPQPPSPETRAKNLGIVTQVGKNYSRLAMASLLSSVVLGIGWLPGMICGHLAKSRMRRDPLLDGEKMANAGLTLSYLMLGVILVTATGFALMLHHWDPVVVIRDTPAARGDLDRRLVDEVLIGEPESEQAHHLQGRYSSLTPQQTGADGATNRWRAAQYGDAFAYTMKVLPDRAMTLNCRFSDNPNQRLFDVIVNDQIVGGEVFRFNVPGHFYDVEYKIPTGVTRGKSDVLVQFRAPNVMISARLYGCQILRP